MRCMHCANRSCRAYMQPCSCRSVRRPAAKRQWQSRSQGDKGALGTGGDQHEAFDRHDALQIRADGGGVLSARGRPPRRSSPTISKSSWSMTVRPTIHSTSRARSPSEDGRVRVIELSRNFGHHKAMMTGLDHARGDLCFLIDSDLEEDPGLLTSFLKRRDRRPRRCLWISGCPERRLVAAGPVKSPGIGSRRSFLTEFRPITSPCD